MVVRAAQGTGAWLRNLTGDADELCEDTEPLHPRVASQVRPVASRGRAANRRALPPVIASLDLLSPLPKPQDSEDDDFYTRSVPSTKLPPSARLNGRVVVDSVGDGLQPWSITVSGELNVKHKLRYIPRYPLKDWQSSYGKGERLHVDKAHLPSTPHTPGQDRPNPPDAGTDGGEGDGYFASQPPFESTGLAGFAAKPRRPPIVSDRQPSEPHPVTLIPVHSGEDVSSMESDNLNVELTVVEKSSTECLDNPDKELTVAVRKLLQPRTKAWEPLAWLELWQRSLWGGRLDSVPALIDTVKQTTNDAIKRGRYATEFNEVDLNHYLQTNRAVNWYGRCNVQVPDSLGNDNPQIAPPLLISDSSPLEILEQLDLMGETKHAVSILLEVTDFDSDGCLKIENCTSAGQQNALLRSDFRNFAQDAAHLIHGISGGSSTMREHLTAPHDPYVFHCSQITVFRGCRDDGYPFLETPICARLIASALPTARPLVNVQQDETKDFWERTSSHWYAEEKDQSGLLERLNLIGLVALQSMQEGEQPVLILSAIGCCDRGQHPRNAVANSLKHWRQRYSSFFRCVIVCCNGDLELANEFDKIINGQVYDTVKSVQPNVAPWHWDDQLLELHVRREELRQVGLLLTSERCGSKDGTTEGPLIFGVGLEAVLQSKFSSYSGISTPDSESSETAAGQRGSTHILSVVKPPSESMEPATGQRGSDHFFGVVHHEEVSPVVVPITDGSEPATGPAKKRRSTLLSDFSFNEAFLEGMKAARGVAPVPSHFERDISSLAPSPCASVEPSRCGSRCASRRGSKDRSGSKDDPEMDVIVPGRGSGRKSSFLEVDAAAFHRPRKLSAKLPSFEEARIEAQTLIVDEFEKELAVKVEQEAVKAEKETALMEQIMKLGEDAEAKPKPVDPAELSRIQQRRKSLEGARKSMEEMRKEMREELLKPRKSLVQGNSRSGSKESVEILKESHIADNSEDDCDSKQPRLDNGFAGTVKRRASKFFQQAGSAEPAKDEKKQLVEVHQLAASVQERIEGVQTKLESAQKQPKLIRVSNVNVNGVGLKRKMMLSRKSSSEEEAGDEEIASNVRRISPSLPAVVMPKSVKKSSKLELKGEGNAAFEAELQRREREADRR